jgi:transcriptional regulator with XRE-family HTH domain
MSAPPTKAKSALVRPRSGDADRYVGARMRERRIILGLTQEQLAELIGVTYQQAHKYENGINRISAGRLSSIAQALRVEVGYFFEGMDSERPFKPTPQQPMLIELARNFISIPSHAHREAICNFALALADPKLAPDATEDATLEP